MLKMMHNNLTLRCETPIHIGNGEKYTFLDYFVDNGIMHVVDIDRVFDEIEDINVIDDLCGDIEKNIINGQAQINIREFFKQYEIDVREYVVGTIKTTVKPSRRVQISQFINQNGNSYIPGSSIKGAIRTAYLFNYYDGNIERLVEILKNPKIGNKYKSINDEAIGDIEKDIFRYLYVSDSEFIPKEKFTVIEARRYNNIKQKEGNPTYLEVINEGTDVKFEIGIDKGFRNSLNDIASWCNNLSGTVVEYEISNRYGGKYQAYYKKLSDEIKRNEDYFYLNLGFGGGHITKAIYLLLWKHNKDLRLIRGILKKERLIKEGMRVNDFYEFPRTRVIFNNMPLGWVKICGRDENDIYIKHRK